VPSRTKGGQDVTQAFGPIADDYKKDNFQMIMLVTDSGNEFSNANFQAAMDRNGTLHRTVELGDHKAMGLVDRAIRTLREKLQKQLVAHETKKWVNLLPGLVKNVNTTINQGVGATPNDIWDGKVAPSSHWDNVFAAADKRKPDKKRYNRFKIGDHVRVKKQGTVFTKKSQTKGFTKNIYFIHGKAGKKFKMPMDDKYSADELTLANDVTDETDIKPPVEEEDVKPAQKAEASERKHKRTFARTGLDETSRSQETLTKRVRRAPDRFAQ
jgi:hypothetical protein